MDAEYGANLDWATHIDIVAATSLDIEGWALYDVGILDEPGTSSTSSTSSTAVREGRGASGRGSAPIPLLLRGTEWYPPAQTCLATIIVGGGLGGSGASHAQGHGLELRPGASHAQGHGGSPQMPGQN